MQNKEMHKQSIFTIHDSKRLNETPITLCYLLMKFFFPSQNNETYVFSIIFTTHAILACPSEAKQQKNLAS